MNEMYATLYKLDELSDLIDSDIISYLEDGDVIYAEDFPDMLFRVDDYTDTKGEFDNTEDFDDDDNCCYPNYIKPHILRDNRNSEKKPDEPIKAEEEEPKQQMLAHKEGDEWVLNEDTADSVKHCWATASEDDRKKSLLWLQTLYEDFDQAKFRNDLSILFQDEPGVPFDSEKKYAIGDIVALPFYTLVNTFGTFGSDWAKIKFDPYGNTTFMYIGDEYGKNE